VRKYLFFALSVIAGTAAAQAPQPTVRTEIVKQLNQNFDKGDVNNDGFLSRNEVQSMTAKGNQQLMQKLEQEFRVLDKDKNGQISLAEFKAAAAAKMAQIPEITLQKFDANKDGKVSAAEFKGPVLAAFDRVDTNKDGKLSPEEKKKAGAR
jgi:Ca2+-binding EF-hand superfamily protein